MSDAEVDRFTELAQAFVQTVKESDDFPEGFDLGVIAVVAEIRSKEDGSSPIWWRCSDPRQWVHIGLFRSASLLADQDVEAGAVE